MEILELQKVANEVRKGIVTSTHSAKAGHPGGSLSAADILTYLYFEEMNVDPKDAKNPDRDRFVLSKVMQHLHYTVCLLTKDISRWKICQHFVILVHIFRDIHALTFRVLIWLQVL